MPAKEAWFWKKGNLPVLDSEEKRILTKNEGQRGIDQNRNA